MKSSGASVRSRPILRFGWRGSWGCLPTSGWSYRWTGISGTPYTARRQAKSTALSPFVLQPEQVLHALTEMRIRLCLANLYPRIHDPAALAWGKGEDRVQVEFADFRNFFNETGYPQQSFFKSFKIGRWMSPIAGEQAVGFDFPDHLRGVAICERRDAELDIAKNLDV